MDSTTIPTSVFVQYFEENRYFRNHGSNQVLEWFTFSFNVTQLRRKPHSPNMNHWVLGPKTQPKLYWDPNQESFNSD